MSETNTLSAGLQARLALEKHGFRFTRALGQNFIFDDDLIDRILDASGIEAGERVLEIGPGAGVMTRRLSDRGARVTAVELDRSLEPVLADVLEDRDVQLVFDDVLKCDIPALMGEEPYSVVANLPYYITTDAILRLLTCDRPPRRITMLVQREAADRVMAEMGTKTWCALSATVRYFAQADMCFEVPPTAFTPPPHVMSAVLRLQLYAPDERPARAHDQAMLLKVIAAAFAMRRKTMANNLTQAFSVSRDTALGWLSEAGLQDKVRGEALSVAQLCRLSDVILDAGQRA